MSLEKVNLREKLDLFEDHWNPRIISELNGQHVKLAKLMGEFVWHKHDDEDELFLVIEGHLTMELRDKTVELDPGEMIVIPKGVEHRPVARSECQVLLFEPDTTLNTGDAQDNRRREKLEWI